MRTTYILIVLALALIAGPALARGHYTADDLAKYTTENETGIASDGQLVFGHIEAGTPVVVVRDGETIQGIVVNFDFWGALTDASTIDQQKEGFLYVLDADGTCELCTNPKLDTVTNDDFKITSIVRG